MNLERLNKNRKQKVSVDISSMIYGKIPPQAKDIEEAVLGVMTLEPQAILEIRNIIQPEDFYVEVHQRICRAIFELSDRNAHVDLLTVTQKLREKEELEICGGPYYLTRLQNTVVSSAHIVTHCRIIKQYSILRKVIEFSGRLISSAYDDATDPFDLLDSVEQEIFNINANIEESKMVPTDVIGVRMVQAFEERRLSDGDPEKEKKYLRSGIKTWDEVTGYFRPGVVYVLAARPGMGKTDFIIQAIANMAKKVDVGFVSAEMNDEEICQRLVCNLAELDNYIWVKPGRFITDDDIKRMFTGLQEFVNLKLHIESRTNRIDRVVSKIKFWVRKFNAKVIFIDFLQILTLSEELSKYMTEVQSLNYILEQIRAAAKELKVPFILLSQLNRELYKRGNKEPGLSDLKGSGKIEEIAYQISFLHRPEYYEITADDMGESTAGLMYQMILKHRGGRTERIKHHYVPKYSKLFPWQGSLPGNFNPVGAGWMPYKDNEDKLTIKTGDKLNDGDKEEPTDELPF